MSSSKNREAPTSPSAAGRGVVTTGILVHLPVKTRNPMNGQTGNSKLAAIIRSQQRAKLRGITKLVVLAAP